MKPLGRPKRRTRLGNALRLMMLKSIALFFRGLFGRKEDDFKSLLIADLGIER
jgi:hypothetical protein